MQQWHLKLTSEPPAETICFFLRITNQHFICILSSNRRFASMSSNSICNSIVSRLLSSEQLCSVQLRCHKGSLVPAKWRNHAINWTCPMSTFKVIVCVRRGRRRRWETKRRLNQEAEMWVWCRRAATVRPERERSFLREMLWDKYVVQKCFLEMHLCFLTITCEGWCAAWRLPMCASSGYCHCCELSAPLDAHWTADSA